MNKSSLINAATLALVSLAAISCNSSRVPVVVLNSKQYPTVGIIAFCSNSRTMSSGVVAYDCDDGRTYKGGSVMTHNQATVLYFP